MELMLLAETFDAATAMSYGLVHRVVASSELTTLENAWVGRLAAGPPRAYRLGKRNLWAGAAGGTLREALDREAEAQVDCLQSEDLQRGVEAFFARTSPKFTGL